MNLGMEDEHTEHKRSTSELREGMESVASILNKHDHGTLYFGVRPSDGEVTGLRRIKSACDEQGVPVEVFQHGGFVHVRFTRSEGIAAGDSATESPKSARMVREKYANALSKTDADILAFVAEEEIVSNADVAERMGMSISGARKALQRLIDAGLISREGQGKRTRYALSEEIADK